MILDFFFGLFSRDMGIDLGTANTLVYVKGKGIMLQEPSVVAIHTGTREVLAVGSEANRMVGRTPGNIVVIKPMKDGVIADFDITETMLRHFITRVHKGIGICRPRVVIGVPCGVTEVEKRAVIDAARQAGAREAYLIEEPMASAIGAGLPIHEPSGNMVVDIGGGTTEIAVISLGGIVTSKSIRVAGDEMNEAIIQHVKRSYNLLIGERTAEDIKISIGRAYHVGDEEEEETLDIKGRDMVTGLPKTVTVTAREIEEALAEPVRQVVDAVHQTLEKTPPELAADIMERGIVLTGGGSLLRGLNLLLAEETKMPVHLTDHPLECVALGTGVALENLNTYRRVLTTSSRMG